MEPAERLDFRGTFRGQRLLRNPLYPRRSTSCAERTNGASQNEGSDQRFVSHPPLEGGQAPGGQPQTLADAGGFYGQSPLQAAETTCARNSGNGFSVRRARRRRNRWRRPQRLWREAPYGVRRRRRPGIAGAAGGIFGNIGLYPLGLGPLKCPFSKAFVSGFLIFKSPTTMD